MSRINGIHHLGITTRDMRGQLQFFCDVLGGELRATGSVPQECR